jgi:hypothetical protein
MLPDVVLLKARPEDVGQLYTGHFAVRCGRWIFRNFNVGIGEVWVRTNQIRPISAVGSSPGLVAPVEAVHENDDSSPWDRLSKVLLYGELREAGGIVDQEKNGDQNKLDLHSHPAFSAHLEPDV